MITAGSSGDSEKRGACSSAGRACSSFVPPSATKATNATAIAAVTAIAPTSTPPSAATPAATATSSSARMSSTIAAPRIVRLARRSSTPRSIRTADVMPTLVATSAAPRNNDGRRRSRRAPTPSAMPPANGIATPSTPTESGRPTDLAQVRQPRLEADPEQQEDDPELGEDLEHLARLDEPEDRRADEHAGEDLADDRRLAQAPEELVAELRREQDDEQIGEDRGDT